jgi:hypothetical protein
MGSFGLMSVSIIIVLGFKILKNMGYLKWKSVVLLAFQEIQAD